MNAQQREKMTKALVELIDAAMLRDPGMRLEAIVEGRIGLAEMADGDFVEFARDCWDLDDQDFCIQCGAPSNDGEGEDGLCGSCADRRYAEQGEPS